MKITLHGHIVIDHMPHHVQVLKQILAPKIILAILSAVFSDVNRLSKLRSPLNACLETFRIVIQESRLRKFGILWVGPLGEHLRPLSKIKADKLPRVIIQPDEILGVLRLGHIFFQEICIELSGYQSLGKSVIEDFIE